MSEKMNHEELHEQDAQDENNASIGEEQVTEEKQEELDPITILEREKKELKEAYLRLSADTDNYRKRMEQEKTAFLKYAVKGLVEKLLPVVDNLERSLQASDTSDKDALKKGVEMVLTQFEGVLKDAGLETVEIKPGDEFDPQVSEAVMMEEIEDAAHPVTVLEVFETGRKIAGQILRTAKVKVAKRKN